MCTCVLVRMCLFVCLFVCVHECVCVCVCVRACLRLAFQLNFLLAFLCLHFALACAWAATQVMTNVPELSQQTKRLQAVARDLYKFGVAAQETGNILQVSQTHRHRHTTHTEKHTQTHTAHTHTHTHTGTHRHTHTYTHGCAASGHLRSTSPRPPLLCGLQFCFGGDGEGAKTALLSSFFDRLEDCRKSISLFLDKKRESFPRFYFLSDMMLLRALGTRLEAGHNVLLPEALQVLLPAARAVEIIDAESAPHVFAQRASLSESELLREEDEFSHDGNSLMIVRIFSHHEEEFDLLKSVLTAVCFAFLSVAKGRKPFCFVCLCFCACVSLCVIVCFSVCGTFLPSIVTHILVIFWRFPPPTLPRHPHPSSPPDHSNSQPRSRFCGRDGVAVCVAGRDWAEPR